MPRSALLLAYDGTGYRGWTAPGSQGAVIDAVQAACARLGETQAQLAGAARTDAGVHARGQVAQLDTTRTWHMAELARALDHQLPEDIACLAACNLAPDFHVQHQAQGKTYSYRLDLGAGRNPFLARHSWRPTSAVDPEALAQAWALCCGRRDWSGFARRGEQREDLVRSVERTWVEQGPLGQYTLWIAGQGFIYHLVRSLVGAAVLVAQGGCQRADLERALAGEAHNPAARAQAPARGLCLEAVHYQPQLAWITPATWLPS